MQEIQYNYYNNGIFPIRCIRRKKGAERSLQNLSHGYRNAGISPGTQRKIAKHCNILAFCAEKRWVKNKHGDYVHHLLSFITLTLPSAQRHDDQFVTKEILGNFIDRLRKIGALSNYVWRAEKQKNGNIHYHLLTDSDVPHTALYRFWILSLKKFEYVQEYTEKFSTMSLSEYVSQPFNRDVPYNTAVERYAKGKRENWSKPPCVHTRRIADCRDVSMYLAKYSAKTDGDEKLRVSGRVWACSQSVSQATRDLCTDQHFNSFFYQIATQIFKRKEIHQDFFSIALFPLSSLRAFYPDAWQYMLPTLRAYFVPCRWGVFDFPELFPGKGTRA